MGWFFRIQAPSAAAAEASGEENGKERTEGGEANADDADGAFSGSPDESVGYDPYMMMVSGVWILLS